MTKAIMIQGAGSNVGKSVLVAGDMPRVGQTRPSPSTVQAAKYVQ
jgi:cobyric acid synthase